MTVRRTAAERATAAVGTVINGTPLYVKTNDLTGNITKMQPVTQAQYDAIATKDAETLYVIVAAA